MPAKKLSLLLALGMCLTGCVTTKTVVIKSEPAESKILIDGVEAGTGSVTKKLEFASRTATFEASATHVGYQDAKVTIGYEPAKQKEYLIQLERIRKTIKLQTQPEGATVFINGQQAGISPLTKELVFERLEQQFEIVARKDGFKDGKGMITYQPAEQLDYKVTLEKIDAIPIELVSVEPQKTERGVKLALVRKPTLAYLEVIERSPNVAAVTRVTANEDKAIQIGPPIMSPVDDTLLYWEFIEEVAGTWYSNIQKQRVGAFAKTRLTYGKWRDLFPAFTPDGKNVIFSANRTSSNPTLWQVSSDRPGGIIKLTNTQAEDFSPTVSPDGHTVVFTSNPPEADEPQIWTVSREASLLTQLREGESPQVSPNAKQILFVRQDKITKKRQLWLMSIDGAEETQLTQNTDYDVIDPRWSPDGKWIVYASDEGLDSQQIRNYDIWLMAANGSKRTQLTTNGSRDDGPCWDYVGETVYFRSNRGGAWNIWRFRPILSNN